MSQTTLCDELQQETPTKSSGPLTCLGHTFANDLVVDKVDKVMHGMQLGAAGMHNQI